MKRPCIPLSGSSLGFYNLSVDFPIEVAEGAKVHSTVSSTNSAVSY